MKIAFAAILLVILSFLAQNCSAQGTNAGHFQSVGGDYARNWLNANAQNQQNSQASQNTQIDQSNQNAQNAQNAQNIQNTQNTQASQSYSSQKKSGSGDLWSWGTAPRGSSIVGGELVANPYYLWPGLSTSYNWLGDSNANPYAERPLYSYTDPKTGETSYGYWDPTSGKMTPVSGDIWQPVFPDDQPYYNGGANSGSAYPAGYQGSANGAGLPPVFSTNDPWA
jgi:hypothetical protein